MSLLLGSDLYCTVYCTVHRTVYCTVYRAVHHTVYRIAVYHAVYRIAVYRIVCRAIDHFPSAVRKISLYITIVKLEYSQTQLKVAIWSVEEC